MLGIVVIIYQIVGLATFVLGILCAIKMFKANEIWQGIVTILCFLFGVYYVMKNKERLGLQQLALPYAACAAACVLLGIVAQVLARV